MKPWGLMRFLMLRNPSPGFLGMRKAHARLGRKDLREVLLLGDVLDAFLAACDPLDSFAA